MIMLQILECLLVLSVFVNGQKNPADMGIIPQDEISVGPSISCDDLEGCKGDTNSICDSNGRTHDSTCDFVRAFCKQKNFRFAHIGPCTISEKCRGHQKTALEEAKRNKGVYIPSCRPDGSYDPVQCHKGTGFCWCSAPDGKPLKTAAKHKELPNCPSDFGPPSRDVDDYTPPSDRPKGSTVGGANSSLPSPHILQECIYFLQGLECPGSSPASPTLDAKSSVPGNKSDNGTHPSPPSTQGGAKPKPARGCQDKKRNRFTKNMLNSFMKEYSWQSLSKKETRKANLVLQWKFNELDKKKDGKLRRNEYKNLQRLTRKHMKPRKCSKKFPLLCDADQDKKISYHEWINCFTIIKRPKKPKKPRNEHRAKNEVRPIGVGPVSLPQPCLHELKELEEISNSGNTNSFIPECDDKGYYKPTQCYGSSDKRLWYCFCVDIQNGTMIQHTVVQNGTPNCPLTSRRKPWPGCPAPDPEARFLKSLTSYLLKFAETINRNIKYLPAATEVEVALYKIFVQLDRNKNDVIDKKEKRNLKKLIKKQRFLWKCGKDIHKVCDINDDKKITLQEFTICILPRKRASISQQSDYADPSVINPFEDVLKGD